MRVVIRSLILIIILMTIIGSVLFYKRSTQKASIVVVKNNGGQLANQLWHYANLYAYCLEQDYDLYLPAFSANYPNYFHHFRFNPTLKCSSDYLKAEGSATGCSQAFFALYSEFVGRIFAKLPGLTQVDSCKTKIPLFPVAEMSKGSRSHVNDVYIEEKPTFHNVASRNILEPVDGNEHYSYLVNGQLVNEESSIFWNKLEPNYYCFYNWGFYWSEGLEKYRNQIKELFKPAEEYAKKIDHFWSTIDDGVFTVGVHIRHADFQKFRGGRYFFTIEEYKQKMAELEQMLSFRKIQFVIFSDEPRKEEEFEGLNCLLFQGNMVEDLYSMAKCQMILGSRGSTYSAWAAWYGNATQVFMEGGQAETMRKIEGMR